MAIIILLAPFVKTMGKYKVFPTLKIRQFLTKIIDLSSNHRILAFNRFENLINGFSNSENPTIDTKIIKIGSIAIEISH